jgi:hypothetical protein
MAAEAELKIVKPGHHLYKHERVSINERSKANTYGDILRAKKNRSVMVCSVDQTLKKTGMVSE